MTSSRLAFDRLPSLGTADVDPWARTVAVLAAWLAGEPARPSLERRLWRSPARGALRETVVVTIDDPLGMLGEDGRREELAELARPLREALALRNGRHPRGPCRHEVWVTSPGCSSLGSTPRSVPALR